MVGLLVRRHPAAFSTVLVRAMGVAALRLHLAGLVLAALLWRSAALLAVSLFWLLWTDETSVCTSLVSEVGRGDGFP